MDKIKFTYNDTAYEMTYDEIYAAYRYLEHEYRLEDAAAQLEYFVLEDYSVYHDEEPWIQNKLDFEAVYGISYEEAASDAMLEAYVEEFENEFDANVAENDRWQNAIEYVLGNLKQGG